MNRCWLLYLFSIVAFVTTGHGVPLAGQRISGGDATKEGDFPYIVSITRNSEHVCGGFIYNQRFVVTAASCLFENDVQLSPSEVSVVVGQYNLIFPDVNERRFQVVNVIPHDSYDSNTKMNDIAVLETSQSIIFTPGHVEFVYYNEVDLIEPAAVVMGWGALQDNGLPSVDLRKANVQISTTDCNPYGSDYFLPNYMVCAGSATASPCIYDEGSPLVQNGFVVGLVSKNDGCTGTVLPTIYTRLSAHYAWLNRNAGTQPVVVP